MNLAEVRSLFRSRLSRQVAKTGDPVLGALYDEFLAECEPDRSFARPDLELEVATSMIFRLRGHELRLFSTITTFGTPQDITLDEISIESYYPADAESAAILQGLADASPVPRGIGVHTAHPTRSQDSEDGGSASVGHQAADVHLPLAAVHARSSGVNPAPL
ncbi:hypothetical protein [Streptomyces sp. Tu 2975]|uniref:MmyB family transcriptional regulator n=1 Tax=Streptomyces sp. Tu 2975 TaxID=2676871 RepID=UPI003264896D